MKRVTYTVQTAYLLLECRVENKYYWSG